MNEPQYPGLHLPEIIGPSEEDSAVIEARWNTLPIVEAELAQEGFFPLAQPTFIFPEITLNILTSPNTEQYTDAYRCAVAWVDYTRDKVARTELELLQLKNTQSEMERTLRNRLIAGTKANTKRPTVQEMNDYVANDPVYSNLVLRMQYLRQKEMVYKSDLERFQDAVKLMSRNVEIRRENWGAGSSQAGQPPFRPGMPGRLP